jgi:hypothetical protein
MLNNIGPPGLILVALIVWGLWKVFNRGSKNKDDK